MGLGRSSDVREWLGYPFNYPIILVILKFSMTYLCLWVHWNMSCSIIHLSWSSWNSLGHAYTFVCIEIQVVKDRAVNLCRVQKEHILELTFRAIKCNVSCISSVSTNYIYILTLMMIIRYFRSKLGPRGKFISFCWIIITYIIQW